MNIALVPLLIGICLNAAAQLFLKAGMARIGHFSFHWEQTIPTLFQALLNPFVMMGLVCYVVSVFAWLMALSRIEVSIAYPLLSIGYVINTIFAYYWLNESVTVMRLVGIALIMSGVFIVARS